MHNKRYITISLLLAILLAFPVFSFGKAPASKKAHKAAHKKAHKKTHKKTYKKKGHKKTKAKVKTQKPVTPATTPAATPPVARPSTSASRGAPDPNADPTAPCHIQGSYPDPSCTPGATLQVTSDQVCVSGYSSTVRNVPTSEKNDVYKEYGVTTRASGQYEIDHFISLELGGSNDIKNLWPEPANPTPGFHQKDQVENYLHSQVCQGAITLQEAQNQISSDWVAVYSRIPSS